MSGLAGSLMLGSGQRTSPRSIQLFEDVEINTYSNSFEVGEVVATLHTLGMIDSEASLKADDEAAGNLVHYRFSWSMKRRTATSPST